MRDYIPNEQLRPEDLPPTEASWDEIGRFALTFSGYKAYGSFAACAAVANARQPSSLTELRACLFFEQRRYRHMDRVPTGESLRYVRGLVEGIRQHVHSAA